MLCTKPDFARLEGAAEALPRFLPSLEDTGKKPRRAFFFMYFRFGFVTKVCFDKIWNHFYTILTTVCTFPHNSFPSDGIAKVLKKVKNVECPALVNYALDLYVDKN